jgi:hypothetical protein
MSTLAATNLKNPSAGSNNIVLNTDGSSTLTRLAGGAITSGTSVASTSGVSIDFTGIPSWAKRVTVMFSGVSTSGTSAPIVRFGAGTVQTTGYASTSSAIAASSSGSESLDTSGFKFSGGANSTAIRHGTITATLIGSSIWSVFGITGQSDVQYTTMIGGSVTLSGTLDRVRITTVNGTDTFDAGSINILYEG